MRRLNGRRVRALRGGLIGRVRLFSSVEAARAATTTLLLCVLVGDLVIVAKVTLVRTRARAWREQRLLLILAAILRDS